MNESNTKIASEFVQKNNKDSGLIALTKEDTAAAPPEVENKLVADVAIALDKLRNKFPDLTVDEIKSMAQTLKEKEKAESKKLPELLDFPEKARAVIAKIHEQRKTILQAILDEPNPDRFLSLYQEGNSLYKTIDQVLNNDIQTKFGEDASLTTRESHTNDFWISQEIATQEADYYSKIRDKAYQLYDSLYSFDQKFVDYSFKEKDSTIVEKVLERKQNYVDLIVQSKFLAHGTTRVMNVLSQGALLSRERIIEKTSIDQFNTGDLKAQDQELHEVTFSLGGIWERYAGFNDARVTDTWKERGKPRVAGVFLYPVTKLLSGESKFYSADGLHVIPPDGEIPLSDLKFVTDDKNLQLMTAEKRIIVEDAEGGSFWDPKVKTEIENDALTPDEAKTLDEILITSQGSEPIVFQSDRDNQFGVTKESVRNVENIVKESFQTPDNTQDYQIFPTGNYEKSLGGYIDTFSFSSDQKT